MLDMTTPKEPFLGDLKFSKFRLLRPPPLKLNLGYITEWPCLKWQLWYTLFSFHQLSAFWVNFQIDYMLKGFWQRSVWIWSLKFWPCDFMIVTTLFLWEMGLLFFLFSFRFHDILWYQLMVMKAETLHVKTKFRIIRKRQWSQEKEAPQKTSQN